MHRYFALLLLLLLGPLQSQNKYLARLGGTISNFYDEVNSGNIYAPVIGISREWSLYGGLSIACEFNYVFRGGVIKNKPIGFWTEIDIYNHDIYASIGYIDIPLMLKYYLNVQQKTKFFFSFGPSYGHPLYDNSDLKQKEFLFRYVPLDRDDAEKDFEYLYVQESSFGQENNRSFINFGFGGQYKEYQVEFRYSRARGVFGFSGDVSKINKHSQTFMLMLGLCF